MKEFYEFVFIIFSARKIHMFDSWINSCLSGKRNSISQSNL